MCPGHTADIYRLPWELGWTWTWHRDYTMLGNPLLRQSFLSDSRPGVCSPGLEAIRIPQRHIDHSETRTPEHSDCVSLRSGQRPQDPPVSDRCPSRNFKPVSSKYSIFLKKQHIERPARQRIVLPGTIAGSRA